MPACDATSATGLIREARAPLTTAMHEFDILKDLVIVLGAAVIVVAVLRRLRLPSIAGFILTGVLVGPTSLGLVSGTHEVEVLAEVGVILLLFGIGLELSLDRVRRLWKVTLVGGGLQVAMTMVATASAGMWLGLEAGPAIFVGCVVSVSSTAVVLRGLSTRGELEAPHGRLAVGILVFQDLCVVPMILALPFLAGTGGTLREAAMTFGTAVFALVVVLGIAGLVASRALAFVASTRERDLFILTVFLICFGTAWAVSEAGISLALGAFLAGLVVAGSEFRHQALSDLIPTRDVLASLFFVSVGMLLDVRDVAAHAVPILGLLLAILIGKFLIVQLASLVLWRSLRVTTLAAASLCQVGEFSFVLLGAAAEAELLEQSLSHNLLVAIILSMLLTPLFIAFAPRLAGRMPAVSWLERDSLHGDGPATGEIADVVVVGYGLAGRAVASNLRDAGVSFVVVDVNPDNVDLAREAGDRAVLGDITRSHLLEEIAGEGTRLVVLSINDAHATQLGLRMAKEAAPNAATVVRTKYEIDRASLRAAGAEVIITEEATAAESMVQASLRFLGRDASALSAIPAPSAAQQ